MGAAPAQAPPSAVGAMWRIQAPRPLNGNWTRAAGAGFMAACYTWASDGRRQVCQQCWAAADTFIFSTCQQLLGLPPKSLLNHPPSSLAWTELMPLPPHALPHLTSSHPLRAPLPLPSSLQLALISILLLPLLPIPFPLPDASLLLSSLDHNRRAFFFSSSLTLALPQPPPSISHSRSPGASQSISFHFFLLPLKSRFVAHLKSFFPSPWTLLTLLVASSPGTGL